MKSFFYYIFNIDKDINYENYYGPIEKGFNLQNSGNLFMDNIIYFHDFLICIMVMIVVLVSFLLGRTLLLFGTPKVPFIVNELKQLLIKAIFFLLDVFLYYAYIILISFCGKIFNLVLVPYFKYYKNKLIDYLKIEKYIKKTNKKDIKFVKTPTLNLAYELYIQKLIKDEAKYFTNILEDSEIIEYDHYNTWQAHNHFDYRYYFYSDVKVEFLWTIFPALILAILAIPSFSLLFSIQKFAAPEITVKVIGHQWYWEYQFLDYMNYKKVIENEDEIIVMSSKKDGSQIIESYMVQEEDLDQGGLRLLEVDNKLFLPINTSIRFLITSDDVLHSWAVPSLGIKVDACPGRLNELIVNIRDIGFYYGQCSELCGWYHGFMPIAIESVLKDEFKSYVMISFLESKIFKK
jgi:heme/copper-type cytochrome/quinol oxidase subunit 2